MQQLTDIQRRGLAEIHAAGGSKILPLIGPNVIRQLHEKGFVMTKDDWRVELTNKGKSFADELFGTPVGV
jgi:Mn-dependent DtxR family transcriptional regulator